VTLAKLERDISLTSHERVFLFMDSCEICRECSIAADKSREPTLARPSPQAMGMDVYTPVRPVGYPINPLTEYTQSMNRCALLMAA
jgi:predicted metal-binding protein